VTGSKGQDGTRIHVLRTPAEVLAEAADDRPDRFCFRCRRRTVHRWFVIGDPNPSYYGPTTSCRCGSCGEDHTNFPGTWWDGPRPISTPVLEALRAALRGRLAAASSIPLKGDD